MIRALAVVAVLMLTATTTLAQTGGDTDPADGVKGPVTPLVDFSSNVMHEVLYRYVNDCLGALPGRTTPLLEKHKGEAQPERNHLHLYAIMEMGYCRLGREKDLEVVFAAEQMFPRAWAVSKRAREIIGAETAENVVCELKGARPRRRQ